MPTATRSIRSAVIRLHSLSTRCLSFCLSVGASVAARHVRFVMSTSSQPSSSNSSSAPSSETLQYGARAPPLSPAVTHRVTPTSQPYRLVGRVVRGFQRGSKQLGFPTANLDPAAFLPTLPSLPRGVYCGYVQINHSPVHPTVLSLGTNPTYNTTEDTLEAYVMGWAGGDFYGEEMRLVVCGYVRPQWTMGGLDELIAWIKTDVAVTEQTLQQPPYVQYKDDEWFMQQRQQQQQVGQQRDGIVVGASNETNATPSSATGSERLRSNV